MTEIWPTVHIENVNKMMKKEPKRCVAVYTGGGDRCKKENGYGDGERFCKKHRGIVILDPDSDCFFDTAPRYGD